MGDYLAKRRLGRASSEAADTRDQLDAAEVVLLDNRPLPLNWGREVKAVEIEGVVISKDRGQRKGRGRRHTGKDRGA